MSLRERFEALRHGPLVFTTYDGSPMARAVYEDGHERLYKKKPLAPRYPCIRCQLMSNEKNGQLCYQCKGDDRLTANQRAYLHAVDGIGLTQFPHCDELILHGPESCGVCAMPKYHRLGSLRMKYDVAFTDQARPDWLALDPCPSTAYRSEKKRDRWPGNRAG